MACLAPAQASTTHHLRRFGPRDVELLVGILLPVAKEKGELKEETIVGVAESSDGLRARVSVEGAVHLARADKLLPGLEAVGIGVLEQAARLVTWRLGVEFADGA